ncbi:hypothetical protein DXG01_012775 [Tephrocybe rancida]|nr:hypothetical protein DXG01_012775 [Tephrocybe rancida]
MAFFGNNNQNPLTIQTTSLAATSAPPDVEVTDLPPDSISSIEFSPQVDYLAVGSWDNSVRVYEIGAGGQSQGKAILQHEAPVLSVCWNKEGKVFSGGVDNAGRMLDLATGQAMQVAQHEKPIKVVKWVDAPGSGLLATGSWDKTIKFWDLRQSNPVANIRLPERCYAMDVQFPLLVAGDADLGIFIYDVNQLKTPYKSIKSPLKLQTRAVACFSSSDGSGFAVGSIEGRLGIQYIEDRDQVKNFTFRCHRRDVVPNSKDQADIYAVNDIRFHPVHGTFATSGGDGTACFWDRGARSRLATFDLGAPVSSIAFNHTGTIFAYAISYDWHKGHAGMVPGHPNKLMLHACNEEEVRRKSAPRK